MNLYIPCRNGIDSQHLLLIDCFIYHGCHVHRYSKVSKMITEDEVHVWNVTYLMINPAACR